MGCSPPGSSVPANFLGKNTGVGCHSLLQEIFPTQGSNRGLLHCRKILYLLSHLVILLPTPSLPFIAVIIMSLFGQHMPYCWGERTQISVLSLPDPLMWMSPVTRQSCVRKPRSPGDRKQSNSSFLRSGVAVVVQSLNHVWLFATPWTVAHQAPPLFTISWSLLKFISFALVVLSHSLLSPSAPAFNLSQNQGLFQWVDSASEWSKLWSFSFSISHSNKYSGLISFRIDWFDLLVVGSVLISLSLAWCYQIEFVWDCHLMGPELAK